jgi:hypothetical protein
MRLVNPGVNRALGSCPAGLVAEAGLRWCGESRRNRTEDPNVEVSQAPGGIINNG